MIFPDYNNLNLSKIGDEILSYWKDNNIFEKSIQSREGAKPFIFLKDLLLRMDFPEFTMY